MKRIRAAVSVVVLFLGFMPVCAQALELFVPLDCNLGDSCFIQNFVDNEAGIEARDFRCGTMTEDANNGTDFRLKNYVQMDAGVEVLAAAGGKVIGVREGFEDVNVKDINPAAVAGKECGNAVVIDHGDGWKTQYCHLQKRSIVVAKGQEVKAGQTLGKVGLSGDTDFPHLTFYVRRYEDYIDPFTTKKAEENHCQKDKPKMQLWNARVREKMLLPESAILAIGFFDSKPEAELSRYGKYDNKAISQDSSVVALWIDLMGVQAGDLLVLKIAAPDGSTVIQHEKNFDQSKTQQFYFTGKQAYEDRGWDPGIYTGTAVLFRKKNDDLAPILKKTVEVYIR